MSVFLTVDVYSGLPNPTWCLTPVQAEELRARLEGLQPALAPESELPGLGYRGILCTSEEIGVGTLRVFRGVAVGAAGPRQDPNRALERWLLDTAGAALSPELRALALAEIEST